MISLRGGREPSSRTKELNIVPFLLCLAFVAAFVVLAIRERRLGRERVRASFDALTFDTADGPVPGSRMQVVKQVLDRMGESQGHDGVNGAFWYCVGPGPTYFVAIAQRVPDAWPRTRLHWLVRPLSETRMRGAPASDDDALRAAFGDVIDDTLRALKIPGH